MTGMKSIVNKYAIMCIFNRAEEISFRYFRNINKVHFSDRIGEVNFVLMRRKYRIAIFLSTPALNHDREIPSTPAKN